MDEVDVAQDVCGASPCSHQEQALENFPQSLAGHVRGSGVGLGGGLEIMP